MACASATAARFLSHAISVTDASRSNGCVRRYSGRSNPKAEPDAYVDRDAWIIVVRDLDRSQAAFEQKTAVGRDLGARSGSSDREHDVLGAERLRVVRIELVLHDAPGCRQPHRRIEIPERLALCASDERDLGGQALAVGVVGG